MITPIRSILKIVGRVAFWAAWPLYIIYFKRGYGRTRILLVQGDRVLVVTNWVSDGKWSLPGGGLHKDESPLLGALRELKEEVGVTAAPEQLQPLGMNEYDAYGHHYQFHCFVMQVQGELPLKKQLHEISEAQWMDYHQLNDHNAAPDLLLTLGMWLGR